MYINKKQRSSGIDYSFPGLYFVTICTKDKKCCFGNIENGEITLNSWGSIAQNFWMKQSEHFKDIKLYDFIVMPNHVHGIINILNTESSFEYNPGKEVKQKRLQKIPVIISAYKSSVSREINKNSNDKSFSWQASFYDRLIRNEEEFDTISVYIVKNPLNWKSDIEYNDYFGKSEILMKKSEIKRYYDEVVIGKNK